MDSVPKYHRLDPGQRREQILDAANELLAERAYDEVSVEDSASTAGVTCGLVHHYFGGHEEVRTALQVSAQQRETARQARHLGL
jgi:AcrR family transcriptional regulator